MKPSKYLELATSILRTEKSTHIFQAHQIYHLQCTTQYTYHGNVPEVWFQCELQI